MEEKTTINRKIKKIMHILNPLAGKGQASKIKENLESNNYVYMSDSADEAADFIKKACVENPETCFTVYGGDGTVFKAVNALMESGYNDLASLKIVPIGSGNDFVHTFEGKSGEFAVDVMKFNGRYAANVSAENTAAQPAASRTARKRSLCRLPAEEAHSEKKEKRAGDVPALLTCERG